MKLVATRLHAASIPYMVTGSIAASLYATRFTRDIDIVLETVPADAERVAQLSEPESCSDRRDIKSLLRSVRAC